MRTSASAEPARIPFDGRLTVDRAVELRKAFENALRRSPLIEVDLRGVTEIDVTFVQLMLEAQHELKAAGGDLTLCPDYPEAVGKVLRDAGLCEHAGLCLGSGKPCAWTGGGQ